MLHRWRQRLWQVQAWLGWRKENGRGCRKGRRSSDGSGEMRSIKGVHCVWWGGRVTLSSLKCEPNPWVLSLLGKL